jgi:hypothetical protein
MALGMQTAHIELRISIAVLGNLSPLLDSPFIVAGLCSVVAPLGVPPKPVA